MDAHFYIPHERRSHTHSGQPWSRTTLRALPAPDNAKKNATTVSATTSASGNTLESWGRQPKDGPRGPGAIKMKNAVPAMFLYEYARHIMAQNPNPEQNTVLDLCCGWQSWQPVCEELGLNYIGVDVRGDRNVQLNRRYA